MSLREHWTNWLQHRNAASVQEEFIEHLVNASPFNPDDLDFVIERGTDFNAVVEGSMGTAPLWFLMLPQRDRVVDDVNDRSAAALAVLERLPGIDVTARNANDESALQVLHQEASLALFTTLLARGCDRPPLALWLSRSDVVRVLLDAGGSQQVDGLEQPVMHRLLHEQGRGGDIVAVADLLRAAGAPLSPWKGETLVQRALRSQNPELVPWLLRHGLEATVHERLRYAAKRFECGADGDELTGILKATRAACGDEATDLQLFWQLSVLAHGRNNDREKAAAAGEESIRRFGLHDVIFDALLPNWLRLPGKLELAWSTWQELQPRFDPQGEAAANIIAHLVVLHVSTRHLREGRSLLAWADDARGTKESRPGLMDFNLACLCALTGDVDGTVRHGTWALGKDYGAGDFDDADFDAVRDEPAFAALIESARRRRHEH